MPHVPCPTLWGISKKTGVGTVLPLIQELHLLFPPLSQSHVPKNSSCSVKSKQPGVMIIHYTARRFCSSWDCCAIYFNLWLKFRWLKAFGFFGLLFPLSALYWLIYLSVFWKSRWDHGKLFPHLWVHPLTQHFLAAWECGLMILLHSWLWASHFYDGFSDARHLSTS